MSGLSTRDNAATPCLTDDYAMSPDLRPALTRIIDKRAKITNEPVEMSERSANEQADNGPDWTSSRPNTFSTSQWL